VMAIWFIAIAIVGLLHISDDWHVFAAVNPYYAATFVAQHGHIGLVTLGAVFLAVTGGEALYADLGHFGRKPIQTAWFGLVLLVLIVLTSSRLAHAYGVAVTTTMVVAGLLGFVVIWRLWKWEWWKAALLLVPLVSIDATFLSANLLKLFEGAWLPILFGVSMVLLILTWQRGTQILIQKTRRIEVPLDSLIRSLEK